MDQQPPAAGTAPSPRALPDRLLRRRTALPAAALILGGAALTACGARTSPPAPTSAAPSHSAPRPSATSSAATTGPGQGGRTGAVSVEPSPAPTTAGSPDGSETSTAGGQAWGTGSEGSPATEGAALIITDVRAGTHDQEGYDRLVVEFSGQGTPGWLAPRWAQEATTPGKGEPIEVGGSHLLIITGTGAIGAPTPEQQARMHRGPLDLSVQGPGIAGAHVDMPFESEFQVVLGTGTQDYRVLTLDDPTRLVIDVAHPPQAG